MITGIDTRITYWHDTTSDEPGWIVDIADEDGSDTLSVHQTERDARLEAKRQRSIRCVPCYRIGEHGERTEVSG